MNARKWIAYFEENAEGVDVDWKAPLHLPDAKKKELAKSLAVFQLGETGDGGTLRKFARRTREWCGFEHYERALDLFTKEEHRHANLLRLMVERLEGELVTQQWTASVFKVLRRPLNLQFELQILLTAELIAEAYYELLRRYIEDEPLERVCAQILKDEVKHTAFHAEFFGAVQARWHVFSTALWGWQFYWIHWCTCEMVWWDHWSCFRQLGVSRREYKRLCERAFRTFLWRINRARSRSLLMKRRRLGGFLTE